MAMDEPILKNKIHRTAGEERIRRQQETMIANRRLVALFVERSSHQWVVRDPEGNFWLIPAVEDGWGHRQPFQLTDEAELEPVPGHYIYMLDLPF
jgi:hypothetical protein